MRFETGICSDTGNVKEVNQDAALVRQASTDFGNVLLAVVCDGMGGLDKGELASATVIEGMSEWFERDFPALLYHGFSQVSLKESWTLLLDGLNDRIRSYGESKHINLGTTITALLLVGDTYYICNVGDSRIYYLRDSIRQITKDQSYIQREMDMGRMTEAEALCSNQRNVLLQCIGVGTQVTPDYYEGHFSPNTAFLLCSDGFRHELSAEEIYAELNPGRLSGEADMNRKLEKLVHTVKSREEEDNITAVVVQII